MDQALENRLDRTLDSRTSRRTLTLFLATFAVAVLASPLFVLYELLLGTLGLVVLGLVSRVREDRATMTATVIAAGVLAGGLPYLLAAAFVA
ncbi:hypothetical protein ACTWP5_10245 [Streptomyces sp. 4N509B]|uniref:hypothetical protein n=1 Tax=Streptomyces sp. 4N509B TaxID=3457413 RepID=UPI003FD54F3B